MFLVYVRASPADLQISVIAFVPEDRLPVAMVGAVCLPVSTRYVLQAGPSTHSVLPDISVLVWMDECRQYSLDLADVSRRTVGFLSIPPVPVGFQVSILPAQ